MRGRLYIFVYEIRTEEERLGASWSSERRRASRIRTAGRPDLHPECQPVYWTAGQRGCVSTNNAGESLDQFCFHYGFNILCL